MVDSVTLVSIVLSALGAGGVVLPGARKLRGIARERKRRRDTRETPPEFYYRSCTVELRVVATDQRYIHRREACLVSRGSSLMRVPWGYRPFGDVRIEDERLNPADASVKMTLVDADASVDQSDGWRRRYIQFGEPLRKGQEVSFVHLQVLTVVGKPLEHFLRWSPIARCDRVTLQVAFAVDPPATVRYSVHASTAEELEWSLLEVDEITGAFSVRIDNPVPGRYYKLRW